MKISCPNCQKNYSIQDSAVPESGLLVKCSQCSTEFKVKIKQEKDVSDIAEKIRNSVEGEADSGSDSTAFDELFNDFKDDSDGIDSRNDIADLNIESHIYDDPLDSEVTVKKDMSSETMKIDEDEFLNELFSDSEKNDSQLEERIMQKSIDQGLDEPSPHFAKESSSNKEEPSSATIFVRKKFSHEILGPFSESQLVELMEGGKILPEDDISSDGVTWEPISEDDSHAVSDESLITKEYPSGLSEMDMGSSEDKTMLSMKNDLGSKDMDMIHQAGGMDQIDISAGPQEQVKVEHVHIPEKSSAKSSKKLKKYYKKSHPIRNFFLFLIFVGAGAGAYYKFYYIPKKEPGVIDGIKKRFSNQKAMGTLTDVREALNQDLYSEYAKSLSILDNYKKKSENIPPTVTGLDALIKLNLLRSYGKKAELLTSLEERLKSSHSQNPENIDLIKAIATLHLYKKEYGLAEKIVKPYVEKNDPEIFFILGVSAMKKKELESADSFLNSGFIYSSGRSSKLAYLIAELKLASGDPGTALAFLNKNININPQHIKSYLLKADILVKNKNKIDEALSFLVDAVQNKIANVEPVEKAKIYALIGKIYRELDDIENAMDAYKSAVSLDEKNLNYLAFLGNLYRENGKASIALDTYGKILSLKPKFIPAVLGKTRTLIALDNPDDAYLELMKVNVKEIKDADLFSMLGEIYTNLEKKKEALTYYDKAIQMDPGTIEPYLAKTIIFLKDNNIGEIKKISEKLAQLDKESYTYNLVLGILNHQEAEYGKAVAAFKKAQTLNSRNDSKVYFYFGQLLFDQEKYRKSSNSFKQALEISEGNREYRISLSKSLAKERKYRDIVELYGNMQGRKGETYKAMEIVSVAYYKLRDYDNALKYINKALAKNASSPILFYKKAEILLAKKELDLAEQAIETSITLDIKEPLSYILHAKILIKRSDFRGAVEKVKEAGQLDKENPNIHLLKGIIYKNLDNYKKALFFFNKVEKKSGLLDQASAEIAECHLHLGDMQKALRYYRKAAKEGNSDIFGPLARIYYEKGNLKKAILYHEKNLKYKKDDFASYKQLAYIYKEQQKFKKSLFYFKKYLKYVKDDTEKTMIEDEIYYIGKKK